MGDTGFIIVDDLNYLTIADLAPRLQRREISAVEVTVVALERIESLNPLLNAFISLQADSALESARGADQEILEGRYRGPLHGIPIALKDVFHIGGVHTTGGSRALADFVPERDATVTARLKQAGAVILGTLHMNELAYGATGTNHHYGPSRNPWNLDHLPGGSSSGPGIAVVAGLVYGAMGTDTGGSIRIPSALCGATGLKPTFGRVSLQGVMALAWSMDHAGPLTRSVEDCALMLQAVAGHDPAYASSLKAPVPNYREGLRSELSGVRLGIPRDPLFQQANPEVLDAVGQAVAILERLGAHVEDVLVPLMQEAFSISTVILMSEATACYLRLLQTQAEEIGPEVRRRLESGFALSGPLYVYAQRVRRAFAEQMHEVLLRVDALVMPTTPVVAPPISGERVQVGETEEDAARVLPNFTRPFNLTGQPTLAIPCGLSSDGLPISLQIAGRPLQEEVVLRIGHAYQQVTDWHRRRPHFRSK